MQFPASFFGSRPRLGQLGSVRTRRMNPEAKARRLARLGCGRLRRGGERRSELGSEAVQSEAKARSGRRVRSEQLSDAKVRFGPKGG